MTDQQKTMVLAERIDQTATLKAEQSHNDYIEIEVGANLASRYKIESKIGEGGMGVVYSASDQQLNRPVAIKLLKRNVSRDRQAVETLKQEAQVAMMLTHPSIMRLINFEKDGEYAFLLMEYVDGLDLLSMADRNPDRRLEPKIVAQVAYKICSALEYAHKKNVIHRDIKPANIMISSKREVKLMDFGIAKMLAAESDEHPQIAGTLAYMAPEVLNGEKPDARVDIYALGLTMYELLSGELPFKGSKASEIIEQHFNKIPPRLEGFDRELTKVIFQCLEKKPNARFQSAAQLRSALGRYLGIDEKDKVSRMKSQVEHEKRKLELERRKVEREAKRLESDREEIEERRSRQRIDSASGAGALAGDYSRKQDAGFAVPFPLAAVAALSGLAGAYAGKMITEGQLIEFESLQAYETASWAIIGAMVIAAPAIFRYGTLEGLSGAVIGAVTGFFVFYIGAAANDYLMENDIWVSHILVTYAPMGILFSAGAAAVQFRSREPKFLAKLAAVTAGVALLSMALPYMGFAEFVFGFDMDNSQYFYVPLVSVVIWVTIDLVEQRLE